MSRNAKDDPSFIRTILNTDLHRKPSGLNLGTKLHKGISAAVDLMPIPAKTKAKIKGCGGCGHRTTELDKI